MNTVYESTLVEQPMSNRIESKDEDYAVYPLGTFAGTIYKVLYRSAAEMLEGFAGVLAVLYLLGAVVFGVALLFYTFSR